MPLAYFHRPGGPPLPFHALGTFFPLVGAAPPPMELLVCSENVGAGACMRGLSEQTSPSLRPMSAAEEEMQGEGLLLSMEVPLDRLAALLATERLRRCAPVSPVPSCTSRARLCDFILKVRVGREEDHYPSPKHFPTHTFFPVFSSLPVP